MAVFRPDLILADYNLPNGMDGLVVATRIREILHRQIPVIVLTGDISTDTLRRIAGEDCVQLNKPVKAAEVMQAIQRLLAIPPRVASVRGRARSEAVQPAGTPVIFVVDDDSHVREGIRGLLEAEGRTVEDFATCEEIPRSLSPGSRRHVFWWMPIAGNDGTGITAAICMPAATGCPPS